MRCYNFVSQTKCYILVFFKSVAKDYCIVLYRIVYEAVYSVPTNSPNRMIGNVSITNFIPKYSRPYTLAQFLFRCSLVLTTAAHAKS